MTSQRFSLKEIIFICQDDAKNNTQIFVTLITHIWRTATACLRGVWASICRSVCMRRTNPCDVRVHAFSLCADWLEVRPRSSRGFFSESGLAALKAATGMRGSTSLLWQCAVEHTHTSIPSWHIHYLSFSPLLSINMPALLSFLLLFTLGT